MRRSATARCFVAISALLLACASSRGGETFRQDGGDGKLKWYQLEPGVFPPEGSAHYIGGELIAVDHVNRSGVLRPDRTDAQLRGEWDIPLPFVMLPYGSVWYRGSPADLRDLPLGTHLHGLFYQNEKPKVAVSKAGSRVAVDAAFGRVLQLTDDFSAAVERGRSWRLDAVDWEKSTITVTGMSRDSVPEAKPVILQFNAATRIWKERGFGTSADLARGQTLLVNLNSCTLKGPGRCTDIWLDETSRELAAAHQLEVHRLFRREHGCAAWIDEVDNEAGTVTATLFGGFDLELQKAFVVNESMYAAVAEENLRTYDQINDRKIGTILELQTVPRPPGSSGLRIKFKPVMLLEGFRPKRFLRLYPAAWSMDYLNREEKLYQ